MPPYVTTPSDPVDPEKKDTTGRRKAFPAAVLATHWNNSRTKKRERRVLNPGFKSNFTD
jgi:hypothetical protein